MVGGTELNGHREHLPSDKTPPPPVSEREMFVGKDTGMGSQAEGMHFMIHLPCLQVSE